MLLASLLRVLLTRSFKPFVFEGSRPGRLDFEALDDLGLYVHIPLDEMFSREIYLAGKLGLVRKNGDNYELTDKGAYYYHYIEQVYTTAYIDKMWNVSRKQAFPEQIILK